ncbi:MAG: serine--tRNA ligase [archaeon]
MLDINQIRQAPDFVIKNIERRKNTEKIQLLKELIIKDEKWRKAIAGLNDLNHVRNNISKEINELKLNGKDISTKLGEAKKLPLAIKEAETLENNLKDEVDSLLLKIPNLLHESVPYGGSDADNVVIKTNGKIKKPTFELIHHGDLAVNLDLAEFKRATKISGVGFFYLKNQLVLLDLALQRYALDILIKKGFSPIQPPFLIRKEPYRGVTDLDFFENQLYKTDEDLFLIATAEHPIAAMYMNETLNEDDLPIKYAGLSPCFRKEIGKHNIDEKGFFRVHQFNKVEQFIFCTEEQSWDLFEGLAENSENLLTALEIPYQKVNVCTGDIGEIATKKYDINGWSPREQKYIELMSCSHCSDYQARRLKIKYLKGNEKKFVTTLNNTMVATTRLLRILLETYQTKEGTFKVPKVLQPYLNCKEITNHN